MVQNTTNASRKTIVLRFARAAVYTGVAAVTAFLVAHAADLNTVVPATVVPVLGAALQALDKYVRDGGDKWA